MSFLIRSRTWPTEASTAYCRPRNFLSVRVLAGLSTISRFLAISALQTPGRADNISGGAVRRPEQGGDTTTALGSAASRRQGPGETSTLVLTRTTAAYSSAP